MIRITRSPLVLRPRLQVKLSAPSLLLLFILWLPSFFLFLMGQTVSAFICGLLHLNLPSSQHFPFFKFSLTYPKRLFLDFLVLVSFSVSLTFTQSNPQSPSGLLFFQWLWIKRTRWMNSRAQRQTIGTPPGTFPKAAAYLTLSQSAFCFCMTDRGGVLLHWNV